MANIELASACKQLKNIIDSLMAVKGETSQVQRKFNIIKKRLVGLKRKVRHINVTTTHTSFFTKKRTCPICMDENHIEQMGFASCSHTFCHACVRRLASRKCPLCSSDLRWCIVFVRKGERVYIQTLRSGPPSPRSESPPPPRSRYDQDPDLPRCYACWRMRSCDCCEEDVYHLFDGDEEAFYSGCPIITSDDM